MTYRIEPTTPTRRHPSGQYTYRIYDDANRLAANYWHDHRGDDHGIEFLDGRTEDSPVGRTPDFLQGGGPNPLRLSDAAQAYLKHQLTPKQPSQHTEP